MGFCAEEAKGDCAQWAPDSAVIIPDTFPMLGGDPLCDNTPWGYIEEKVSPVFCRGEGLAVGEAWEAREVWQLDL